MATFPELEPATRSYDFGLFPLSEEPSISAGIVRFRHDITAENYTVTLGFSGLTDTQASLIRNHFQEQGGGYRSFQLPPIVWKGHTFTGNVAPYITRWRYIEAPEEEHFSIGYVNVTVTLVSDGRIDAGFGDVAATIAAGGAAGGAAGFTQTVTVNMTEGAATGT